MRIVVWNCNMALHRKLDALLRVNPDVAVVCECAAPDRLRARVGPDRVGCDVVWVGQNPNKGLAVFAFNGYTARLAKPHHRALCYVAPVHVGGPVQCNVLAVWAQNTIRGANRKGRLGPLRRALVRYRMFLAARPAIVAGDLNSNAIWDRPGWRNNHSATVAALGALGLVSAYHAVRGERHGRETAPTLYWRDRRKDGPTYHIDYVFLPRRWIGRVARVRLGAFDDWCGSGLSDHVPVIVDVDL